MDEGGAESSVEVPVGVLCDEREQEAGDSTRPLGGTGRGEVVREMCQQYSRYLNCGAIVDEQLKPLKPAVEVLTGRLDEFRSFLDAIILEHTQAREVILPSLAAEARALESTFFFLDMLSTLVHRIEQTTAAIEDRLGLLEREQTMKKVSRFMPFRQLKSKKQTPDSSEAVEVNLRVSEVFGRFRTRALDLQAATAADL